MAKKLQQISGYELLLKIKMFWKTKAKQSKNKMKKRKQKSQDCGVYVCTLV